MTSCDLSGTLLDLCKRIMSSKCARNFVQTSCKLDESRFEGGDLHILGDRYLGMLGDDGTQLQVFDIQNSGTRFENPTVSLFMEKNTDEMKFR